MAESAAKTMLDNISRGHLECPICCSRFNDPKMLDCLHSFCSKCLEEMMRKQKSLAKKITCPVCRRETKVLDGRLHSLSSSFFLISLVDEINKQEQLLGKTSTSSATCESCEGELEAVARCLDCKENICKKCRKAHRRVKSTKDHCVIPAQDIDTSRALPKTVTPSCTKHSDHKICFYCETCDTLICSMCAATEHRSAEHKFIGITDATQSFRKNVNDILQKFEESKEQFASNEDSIKRARDRLHKKLAQARRVISAKAEAEIAKIRSKAKLLTKRVNEIGKKRDSKFEKVLAHNRDQMERAEQIVAAINDLMRQANDFEVLDLKAKVMHNLEFQKELKCEAAKLCNAFIGVKCQDVVRDLDVGEIFLDEKWQLKKRFGEKGSGDGEFEYANGVACFTNGDIVVTDTTQKRLTLFNSIGQFKKSVAHGIGRHQLEAPWRVAVTCDDLLFVTDKMKVKVFDKDLHFIREFTPSVNDPDGQSPKSFLGGIAVEEQRVAAVDTRRQVIIVHSLDGSLIAVTAKGVVGNFIALNKDRLIFTKYEEGKLLCVDINGKEVFNVTLQSLNGKPAKPTGVLCDEDGSIYVAVHSGEVCNTEVHHYDPNGAFIATVAQGLHNPLGMAFTPAGDVVVADTFSVNIFERM